jgi:hypothetical protein
MLITPKILADLYSDRCRLLDQGYQPIPVQASSKRPLIPEWQRGIVNRDHLRYLTYHYPDHLSTGLRTDLMPSVDIDLHDDTHSENLRELTESLIGPTPLRRRGSKGYMLAYRLVGDPIGKLVIKKTPDSDGKSKTLLEIFGAGNQFVAMGIHPLTQRPYQWLVPGCDPFTVPYRELPPVTGTQLETLQAALSERLKELGYQPTEVASRTYEAPPPRVGKPQDADTVTELFLRLVPTQTNRSGWINFVCPACRKDGRKAGLCVKATGGFYFHCFHSSCEYNRTTGWEPGGVVGVRTHQLYELLGGDKADLNRYNKNRLNTMTDEYRNSIVEIYDLINQLTNKGARHK